MNPRLSLAVVLVLLAIGAGYLLLQSSAEVAPQVPTPAPEAPATPQRSAPPPVADAFYVLAVSWQPAFCETAPGKPECRSQSPGRFDASHFTLHGLWPRDEYCEVSSRDESADRNGRWSDLPPVQLSPALQRRLDTAMPGTQSQLERHEWLKHGTCFPADAETYFTAALALLDQLNASPVRDLFTGNTGKHVTQRQIRAAFDTAFGRGAGERVRVACDDDRDRTLVTELTLGLWGTIGPTPDLAGLLAAARPTSGGCAGGTVDAVGLQ